MHHFVKTLCKKRCITGITRLTVHTDLALLHLFIFRVYLQHLTALRIVHHNGLISLCRHGQNSTTHNTTGHPGTFQQHFTLCTKKLIGRGRERVIEREIVRERDKRTREAWSRIETEYLTFMLCEMVLLCCVKSLFSHSHSTSIQTYLNPFSSPK